MSLRTRRLLILLAAMILAGILAFPLRETIYETVVIPVAFIAWYLDIIYRSLSQGIWWWIVIIGVVFMLAFSLVPRSKFRNNVGSKPKPQFGQVESLAAWLQKAERGIYFKWLIANRLGKLAYQILLQRESGRPRSVFAPLMGPDWQPTKELQAYLETGLHGSFAEFPNVNPPLRALLKTPLDLDVSEAVEFLETQLENGTSKQRS